MHASPALADRCLSAAARSVCGITLALLTSLPTHAASQCHGTVAKGRIDGAVKLPLDGKNFRAYSPLAATLGRTHVHSRVAEVLVAAFEALHSERPGTQFVYGETGKRQGGPMAPHRTHQNGLSVDLFVPVLDAQGRSRPLPTPVTLRFGYDIEFDAEGRYEDLRIDFDALAAQLLAVREAAAARGVGIARVIIDPAYLPRLFATPQGGQLKALPWMKTKPWVRHDEHFHIDFALPCKPLPS